MISLRGRVVLVTGASSGIGEAMARAFAAQGARLALGARRTDRLEALKRALEKEHKTEVFVHTLDVRRAESVRKFVTAVHERFGRVDILVNNAGLALSTDPIVNAREEEWEQMFETNVLGLLHVTKAVVPRMIEQEEGGHVINIASIASHVSYEGGSAYAGSKHAVRAINDALRYEVLGKPIRVTSIDPGMVETEFSIVRYRGDTAKAKQVYQGMTPLRAEDIADCAIFAATRPPHVNIDRILVNPRDQAFLKVHRT